MPTNNAWNSTFPAGISQGGTNAASMSTSTGIVKYDGTSLVTSSTVKIDSSNRITNSSQCCFFAYRSTNATNVTGDGTAYTVVFDSTLFDQNSNFNTSTGTFTAPITGTYQFNYTVCISNLGVAHTDWTSSFLSATNKKGVRLNPGVIMSGGSNEINLSCSILRKMTAGNTGTIGVTVSGSTKTVTVEGGSGPYFTTFSGFLIC